MILLLQSVLFWKVIMLFNFCICIVCTYNCMAIMANAQAIQVQNYGLMACQHFVSISYMFATIEPGAS